MAHPCGRCRARWSCPPREPVHGLDVDAAELDIVLAVREEDLEVEERFHQWLTHAGDAVHDGVVPPGNQSMDSMSMRPNWTSYWRFVKKTLKSRSASINGSPMREMPCTMELSDLWRVSFLTEPPMHRRSYV